MITPGFERLYQQLWRMSRIIGIDCFITRSLFCFVAIIIVFQLNSDLEFQCGNNQLKSYINKGLGFYIFMLFRYPINIRSKSQTWTSGNQTVLQYYGPLFPSCSKYPMSAKLWKELLAKLKKTFYNSNMHDESDTKNILLRSNIVFTTRQHWNGEGLNKEAVT